MLPRQPTKLLSGRGEEEAQFLLLGIDTVVFIDLPVSIFEAVVTALQICRLLSETPGL